MKIEELEKSKIKYLDVNTVYGEDNETVQELICNLKSSILELEAIIKEMQLMIENSNIDTHGVIHNTIDERIKAEVNYLRGENDGTDVS